MPFLPPNQQRQSTEGIGEQKQSNVTENMENLRRDSAKRRQNVNETRCFCSIAAAFFVHGFRPFFKQDTGIESAPHETYLGEVVFIDFAVQERDGQTDKQFC